MHNPETILAVILLAVGVAAAWGRWRWTGWWERPLARLAGRRWLAIVAVAAAPVLLRLALLPWFPPPEPQVHDEFSFLLAADTLAHGRLTNPPHPFWVHFESVHILTHPVYASAFPIAPPALLALGMVLFGHPWAGVMLGVALMCGSVCWMLQGWVPARWALLGAIVLALRLGVSSYWMNSYWGGAVAATGGALALGALPRIVRCPDWRNSVVMGAGLALLAHSRPFEGGVLGLAIAAATAIQLAGKNGPPRGAILRGIAIPLALALAVAAAGTAWYFYRVTGNPLLPPYSLYRSTLSLAPHFVWQGLRPAPLYNNNEMRYFFEGWEVYSYNLARNAPAADLWRKTGAYWRFYFGPLLSIPLLAFLSFRRDRKARLALAMAAGFFLALLPEVWHNSHYAAPATALAVLLVILGMRRLRLWRWQGLPAGRHIVRCLPPACAILLGITVLAGAPPADIVLHPGWRWPAVYRERARILHQLRGIPGQHLVFVRYGGKHDPGNEWVYNESEIDAARVVWARELDPGSNAKLMRYFAGRTLWVVEPDQPSPRLTPYLDAPFQPMHFVPLGAPGIEALQPGPQLKSRMMEKAAVRPDALLACDAWNRIFTQTTGVEAPDSTSGCSDENNRAEPVTLDRWHDWLSRRR